MGSGKATSEESASVDAGEDLQSSRGQTEKVVNHILQTMKNEDEEFKLCRGKPLQDQAALLLKKETENLPKSTDPVLEGEEPWPRKFRG